MPYLSVLLGLFIDLLGAFLLTVEAIGLTRIRSWKSNTAAATSIMRESNVAALDSRAKAAGMRWLPHVMIGTSCALGGGIGAYLAINLASHSPAGPIIGLVVGGVIAMFLGDAAKLLLKATARLFGWVEDVSGQGTIGLYGFVLLVVGFSLQAIGTIGQWIASRHPN